MSLPSSRVIDLGADLPAALDAAETAIHSGECIVMPTDTVYGIGADAFDARAVQRLLDAKKRGRDMPPPVLVADADVLDEIAMDIADGARVLAARCWPGALTLVVPVKPELELDLGELRSTIAVRVPDHDGVRALLARTGPLAVSSANTSGLPPATDADAARAMLGDSVAVYLDGGPTPGDVPSTIVDFAGAPGGRILRQGAIALADLQALVPTIQGSPEA
ncbi:MAG: L-threonylcarbamoyladenylate synthase [Propionibacteriaceae bacterium]|nr:L-threonylcarbamoyladenylate synthase [Propionibacteriaceae bacterium]